MPKKAYSPMPPLTPVVWIGSSLDDLKDCPEAVKDVMGRGLLEAQMGYFPAVGKRLKGRLGGLVELIDDFDGSTYRGVYTAKLAGAIYVLHVFQKKSKHGIATPRHEVDLILERLKRAKADHTERFGKKGDKK